MTRPMTRATRKSRILPALLLSFVAAAPFLAPVLAQEAASALRGSVAEVFGGQVVLVTPEGRVLATLPEGTEPPAPGAWLELTGSRSGSTFAATGVAPAEPPAALSAAVPSTAEEAVLPEALRGLGLRDVRTRLDREDGETHILARLPEVGGLRAEIRRDGSIAEVQSDHVALPAALVERLLPASVRAEPRLAEIAMLTEIEIDQDGDIDLKGRSAEGLRIEVEFDRAGRLEDFERERDDRRSLSEEAARERLTALGYRDVLWIERGGRHVSALAANPHGEVVEVRLNAAGEVERERLWRD